MQNRLWVFGAILGGTCAALLGFATLLDAAPDELAKEFANDVPKATKTARPKLGVVIVFDQLRGDYLIKWKDLFVEGGFKRLQTEGAWFTDCHYPYSDTVTAAGHTSLLTGCTPRDHGIIGNSWYERGSGKRVQSVSGLIGPDPMRRRRATLGDALMEQTHGKAKVASLSIKDRAAILMAALRAQLVYWLSAEDQFETSRHYAPNVRPWVDDFNKAGKIQAYFGRPWNRLRDRLDYQRFSGPDNFKFEGSGYDQGQTFPHPTPHASAVECSPFGNEVLLDFAKTAIEKEALGRGDVPDLLCLSFSSNDLIGHSFGPDSQEVLDVTLRSDLIVKELLDFLDAKIGKGNYFVALSADHGICPLPEAARQQGKVSARVLNTLLSTQAQAFLQKTFAPGKAKVEWIEATSSSWVYLDQAVIAEQGLEPGVVETALAGWLMKQSGVERAYTRSQLSSKEPLADGVAEQVRQSFHPDRSGDVTAILKPYHFLWGTTTIKGGGSSCTTHGSPHAYDTHVPLLVFGPGVNAGIYTGRVAPQALTPIVARGLGIRPPATATFTVPDGLFKSTAAVDVP